MPKLEAVDDRAIARAAKGLAPMLRRRTGLFAMRGGGERELASWIRACLEAVEDDDLAARDPLDDAFVWCRVERSGLVLVGVADRAYIVARCAPRGGRATRLLVR
jgi:hypothetical protein